MKLECDVIRDLLPLYAEKLASPASSALVEQHLSECPACRAELEQMEKPVPVQPEPPPTAHHAVQLCGSAGGGVRLWLVRLHRL